MGFVSGSGGRKTAMPQSQICVDSVKEGIAAAFTMLRITKPEALPALAAEYTRLTKALNVAYAYCEFASYVTAYADVFGDLGIEDAIRVNEELTLGDPGVDDASADSSTPTVTSTKYGEYAHFSNLTHDSIRHLLVRQSSDDASTTTETKCTVTAADGEKKDCETEVTWSPLTGFSFEQAARVLARLAGLFYGDAFEQVRCMQYGWYGEYGYTMYQVGECTGYLFTEIFDTSLG